MTNQLIAIAAACVPGLIAIVGGLVAFGQLRQRVSDMERTAIELAKDLHMVRQIEVTLGGISESNSRQDKTIAKLQERLDELLNILTQLRVSMAAATGRGNNKND